MMEIPTWKKLDTTLEMLLCHYYGAHIKSTYFQEMIFPHSILKPGQWKKLVLVHELVYTQLSLAEYGLERISGKSRGNQSSHHCSATNGLWTTVSSLVKWETPKKSFLQLLLALTICDSGCLHFLLPKTQGSTVQGHSQQVLQSGTNMRNKKI